MSAGATDRYLICPRLDSRYDEIRRRWVIKRHDGRRWRRIAELRGARLLGTESLILAIADRTRISRDLELRGSAGCRVALIACAVTGLRSQHGVRRVAELVLFLAEEECHYWLAQCWRSRRGAKALRVLLGVTDA